ncbi:hypothetical protein H9X96_14605 [Pedobacter sp. N36a]|uniref:hypothetical protein n=1 Tax=Pedobacter sp. N36a TaxID=2767996 RepID=UPI0016576397|nr:hypothetical protein [Pedobacter sp. N36a]MBC8987003.1 hypothetical protein [Pedobacter sp. N36a]
MLKVRACLLRLSKGAMIRIVLSMILVVFSTSMTFAQNIRVSSMSYSFSVPDGDAMVQKKHYELLVAQLKKNFKNSVSFSNQSPFYIVPKINVLSNMTAGDMGDVKVMKLQVQFTLENPDLHVTFNTFSKTTNITADNVDAAIFKVIQEIKPNDKKINEFLQSGEQLIKDFYQENCAKILKSATVSIDRKEFSKAFSLLRYVPEELGCYKEVEKLITSIYQQHKNEYCSNQLLKAKLEESKEGYDKALAQLRFVDPGADCYKDVSTLLQQIGTKVNLETIRQFEMEKMIFEKKTEIEKMKILVTHTDEVTVHIDHKI